MSYNAEAVLLAPASRYCADCTYIKFLCQCRPVDDRTEPGPKDGEE